MGNIIESKYKSLVNWRENDPKAYDAAYRNGLIPEICETFGWVLLKIRKRGYWQIKENVINSAKECNGREEWHNKYGAAYESSKRNGWFDEAIQHMSLNSNIKERGYWNIKENIINSINGYNTVTKWMGNYRGAYKSSVKNGWFDECKEIINKNGEKYL